KQLTEARKTLPPDPRILAWRLDQLSSLLLKAKAFAEAEPMLRESLAIHEMVQPEFWSAFNAHSMLGGALLRQKKYADAEPLLLKGYEGMKQQEKWIPDWFRDGLPEAIERLRLI